MIPLTQYILQVTKLGLTFRPGKETDVKNSPMVSGLKENCYE